MRVAFAPASCLALVVACGGGAGDGFASSMGAGITSASVGTDLSGSTSRASSTSSSTSTSGANSTSGGEASSTSASSTGTIYDVGSGEDFGPVQPPGCKDKIDFLFLMQRVVTLPIHQQKLIDAFPAFIDTIQERFAGFDVHIMVIDSDWWWGAPACDPKGCIATNGNGCKVNDVLVPDYPCFVYDAINADKCNITLGAGLTFNAGQGAANKPCKIDGGRRYMTQTQSDLKGTFACLAQVGRGGGERVGSAITAALSPAFNGDGGCNAGFLRDDALLMITLALFANDEISEGTPEDWANAVFAAKNGNKNSVIMMGIGSWGNPPEASGNVGKYVELFPYHHFAPTSDDSYGPHFAAAVDLVDEACKVFTPG